MALLVPEELRIAVTRQCDGVCRHCYNESGINTDCLRTEDYIEIIDKVKQANNDFDRITLTGGEPLLEKEKVIAIAKAAKSKSIRVRLVTRGWELAPNLCKSLKEAGITRIQIGLDSSGKKSFIDHDGKKWDTFHSWLRGDEKAFIKAKQGIQFALNTGIDVSIRYSLAKANLDDVVAIYEMLADIDVSKFKFRLLFPNGRAKKTLITQLVNGTEYAEAQFRLIQASIHKNTMIEVTQPCLFNLPDRAEMEGKQMEQKLYKETCPCGLKAGYVDSNGDIKYCLFDTQAMSNMKGCGFLEAWNSKSAEDVRKKRYPIDNTGVSCSSFKLIYEQFGNYNLFIQEYEDRVKQLSFS